MGLRSILDGPNLKYNREPIWVAGQCLHVLHISPPHLMISSTQQIYSRPLLRSRSTVDLLSRATDLLKLGLLDTQWTVDPRSVCRISPHLVWSGLVWCMKLGCWTLSAVQTLHALCIYHLLPAPVCPRHP